MRNNLLLLPFVAFIFTTSCSDDNKENIVYDYPDDLHTEISAAEAYAGGKLGTTFNQSGSSYEDPTPAVEADPVLDQNFLKGEDFFEHRYTQFEEPRKGLGPAYVRSSCIDCHPAYGHGKRKDRYNASDEGNGYLLVIADKNEEWYLNSLTGMPQTRAVAPFKAPIDESKINIEWLSYKDDWGNTFPDGETYDLIYPEVTIAEDAFYVPLKWKGQPIDHKDVVVKLESTIGIYGTGMLDAIPDEAIKEQYDRESKYVRLNPAKYKDGQLATYKYSNRSKNHKASKVETNLYPRYTYGLTRASLQDGPGANAIWNITNVTRSDRTYNYITKDYALISSKDPDVQRDFYKKFPNENKTGDVEKDIYNFLMADDIAPEMSDEQYTQFMVWHRGLAVPAARNLDDKDVQLGHRLFRQIGCASCHRPSWKTGEDNYSDPNGFFKAGDGKLPRYPNQTIWPYTDLIQHRLEMKNNIRTGWCRTTPLWGRGLSLQNTGAADRLHDMRARNVVEAIMWHGAKESDARKSTERFRNLNKVERDAIVKFINAI